MARASVSAKKAVTTGVDAALTAAPADGVAFTNRGSEALLVTNDGGAPVNVTVQTGATVGGRAVGDDIVAVPAGGTRLIGPFDPSVYNQVSGADKGKVYVDFSDVTSVTYQVMQVS